MIANECKGLKSLQVIDMQSNNIDAEGAKALWQLCDNIPGLWIGLHNNL